MKPYDNQREYLSWYFKNYPHVMVVRGFIDYDWMKENLDKSMHSTNEDCMGREYPVTLIGYGISGVQHRPDQNFYLWHDRKHFDKVAEAFPEQMVTLDPFGPEVCRHCGLTP